MNRSSGANATRSASRPTAIAPLRGQAGQPGRRLGHPPDHVGQRRPRAAGPGPDRRQRQLERGDPAPGQPEVADVEPLELRGARRVVADDEVDVAVAQRRPQRLAVRGLPDRRAALERRRAVRDVLRGEGEVVRARLDGDPHPLGAGPRAAAAARRRRPGGRRAPAAPCRGPPRSDRRWPSPPPLPAGRRGTPRSSGRPRPGAAAMTSGSSAWTMSRPSKVASSVSAARSPASSSGGNSGTPESSRKHLKPTTPASCSGRSWSSVARDGAAPEADVDRDLALRGRAFHVQRLDRGRRRDRVERHVDDRGDPAGGRRAGGAGEALPLGAAGLVDVHVAVDQPGQQHLVVGQGDRGGADVVVRGDRGDPAVPAVHGGGPLPLGQHDPPGTDDETHAVTLTPGPVSDPAAATTRCSSAPHAVVTQPPGSGSRTASSPVATSAASSAMCTVDA